MMKFATWIWKNLENFLGFAGTLLMSFAMAATEDAGQLNQKYLEALENNTIDYAHQEQYLDHFVMMKHPLMNQIGLFLIGFAFALPFLKKLPAKIGVPIGIAVIFLFIWLVRRFA